MDKKKNSYVKTTLYISKLLRDEAKIIAVLANTSVSHLMGIALREKIDKLKKEHSEISG